MEKIFQAVGSVTGRFYNTHQAWSKAPEWVKQQYKLGEEQHCGDITTIPSGALHGLFEAVDIIVKKNPKDAAQMGVQVAQIAGMKEENGVAFASGFLETARFNGRCA